MSGYSEIVEWKGDTKRVPGESYDFMDFVVGNITDACFVRVQLAGEKESNIAFLEKKEHLSKKIIWIWGGWGNKNLPEWIPEG